MTNDDPKTKYRALLINPHDIKYHREREMLNRISGVEGIENFPDLPLLCIAAFFDDQWDLTYIDEDRLRQQGRPLNYLQGDYDLALVTAMNHQAYRAYEIIDKLKRSGAYTVMGGMHASAMPEEALQHADTVVVGEGEEVIAQFIEDFKKGRPKRTYRSTGDLDLAALPPPRFDIVEDVTWYNKVSLFATRGCPRRCEFCCLRGVYGGSYRKKAPSQVADEIRRVQQIYPGAFISFADENMLADHKWGKALAKELIPLNIRWEAYCDVSVGKDEELLNLLYQSGCVELLIGFETLDVENLKMTDPWKAKNLQRYGEYIRRIQNAGIGILGCFVVGFDHDTPETFTRLRDFLCENPLFELDIAALTPMPGTPLHERLQKEGRLFNRKWDDYTWYHVNFQPMHLTPGQIHKGIKRVFEDYNKGEMLRKRREMFERIEERMPDEVGRNY